MHRNENMRRMLKICLLVLLCNEMHSSFSHESVRPKRYINALHGHVATADAAKYHASIRLIAREAQFGDGHICSGALIAPSVVLTAAHCLHNYERNAGRHPAEFRVVMGTLDRYKRTATTLAFGVTHVHRPSTFEPMTRRDNIGLMLLDHDVPDDAQSPVQPIAFHMAQFYNMKLEANAIFELTSWSATASGVPVQQLLVLNVTKTSSDYCLQRYGTHYAGTMCMRTAVAAAAAAATQACALDGGAPLLYDDQLWALTSNLDNRLCDGDGDGDGDDVGQASELASNSPQPVVVYTDVAYYTKWILDIIGTGHHQNSSWWGGIMLLVLTLLAINNICYTKL